MASAGLRLDAFGVDRLRRRGSAAYALRGVAFGGSKPIGRLASHLDMPGRKASAPTATGAHSAAISVGVQCTSSATNTTTEGDGGGEHEGDERLSPRGEHRVRTTEATSTAAQASRNCSLPMPSPPASDSSPEPATPTFGSAPVPARRRRPGRRRSVHGSRRGRQEVHRLRPRGRCREAVHVVARIGGPGDERRAASAGRRRRRVPRRVRSPLHRVRSRVTADATASTRRRRRRGQRLGEGAQGEEFAVENPLRGEGARAVEDSAVAAYEVVADRSARAGLSPGRAEDLRIDVGDHVVGQCHVDPAVGRDDGDPAEAEARVRPVRGSGPGPPAPVVVAELSCSPAAPPQ